LDLRSAIASLRGALAILVLLPLAGCPLAPPPAEDDPLDAKLAPLLAEHEVSAITKPTTNAAKVALGRALFFDKLLSGNENISCATCHSPLTFTADGLSLSKGQGGVGLGQFRAAPLDEEGDPILIPRNATDVFNRAGMTVMFWDGRVRSHADGTFDSPAGAMLPEGADNALAVQALFPVTSRDEMRGAPGENEVADMADDDFPAIWSALMARLLEIEEYRALFAAAYPDVPEGALGFVHAGNAIAAFEVEHWTFDDSPFDSYLRGDRSAMSDAAKRGATLFFGTARCADCHTGPLLTDEKFHNRCVPQVGPGKGDGPDGTWDFGRLRVTGDPADQFRFRTPPLRNVAVTGPWMHDGAYTTLEAAVRHELNPRSGGAAYDPIALTDEMSRVFRGEQMVDIVAVATQEDTQTVSLSDAEVADLVAFLEALTSPSVADMAIRDVPERVPSGLPLAD
jgi:cytochrome c peroxidase